MLSNKETAAEVLQMMRQCSGLLDGSVARVMETCPHEEFKAYRTPIGQIMGAIYCDILRPIFAHYPDLEPEEWKPDKSKARIPPEDS